MSVAGRKAMVFSDYIDIRFADLDPYGHVNSKHYVDIVSTARLNFLLKERKISTTDMTNSGYAFFLSKSTIHYRSPIRGLQKVHASSHVEEIQDGKVLIVPFTITSENRDKVYSDGVLEFKIVDMKTLRGTSASEYVLDLFFEPAA